MHHIRLSADQRTVYVGVAKGVIFLYDVRVLERGVSRGNKQCSVDIVL